MANTYNITAKETTPKRYCHLNGTPEQILDRFAVSELCRAWPVYRDASEWRNFRDAWVDQGSCLWTSTSHLVDCPFSNVANECQPGVEVSTSTTF
jgi:hypothetical protein